MTPDHATLLDAVAQYLMEDVAPRLASDKAAQFRVLIAANLTTVVSAELRAGAQLDERRRVGGELIDALKRGDLSDERFHELVASAKLQARKYLEIVNPRFDTEFDGE